MSQRRGVALVAAAAVFLSTSVLSTIFQLFSWVLYSFLAIAVVVVVAILARTLRIPVWGQAPAMLAGLLLLATWTFPSGRELLGFLPSGHTFAHFHSLLTAAGQDIQTLSVPVPERVSLDFLVTIGVGLVAVAVDILAVGMRHPALAGLPLLALYSVPVAIHADSVSWLPFVLGAAGYLWLLMTDHIDRVRRWGRRFAGDGRDIDAWEPSPLAAAGRRVGFAALVLAVVLPLVVPGFTSNLLNRVAGYNSGTGSGTGSGTRLGTSINPISTLRGSLTLGQPINLFQVQTDDPDPGYLRTAVADQITDAGFRPSPPRHPQALGAGLNAPTDGVTASLKYDKYHASVKAQRLDDRYLPLFSGPTEVRAPGGTDWRYEPSTGVVFTDHPATAGANWSINYDSFQYQPAQLRQAPALDPAEPVVRDNTEVRHIAQISRQVDALTAGKTSEYDRVRAILDFFSPENHFKYSLQTKAGTSGSAIVDFLKGRQGYCEQYASAMAWMTREAGIPARVVVGYTHGTRLGNSATWQVTSHEAHAWVEVWFPAFGWVPFDPTPSNEVTGSATFGWAPNPSVPDPASDPAASGKDQPGKSAGGATDQGQHGGPGLGNSANGAKATPSTWQYWVLGVLGVLVLLVLLAIPAGRRGLLRRRRDRAEVRAVSAVTVATGGPEVTVDGGDTTHHANARRAAHAAWDELIDSLVDFRYDVSDSETPRVTAERLVRRPGLAGDAAASVRLLAEAEERARYAPTPREATGLRAASRQVRAGLSAGVPRYRRIAAVLVPRSVLRRWRVAVVDTATTFTARLGSLRHRAYRAVVPRRLLRPRTGRSGRPGPEAPRANT